MRKTMLIASAMALTAAQVGVAQAAPVTQPTKVSASAFRAGTDARANSQLVGGGAGIFVTIVAVVAIGLGIYVAIRNGNHDRPTSP